MKVRDSKTGAMVRNAYSVIKYCGGVNCGSAIDFATLDQCMEFANDGFCDYCRITCDDGSVLKIHFTTPEQETMEPAGQWERVVGADVVEDTYKETRDFEHFEI